MADANLHLKLSKKVAQLTKVIYHLNTKNEDHEASLKALTEQHDAELRDAMEDAAAKIRQLKAALESRAKGGVAQEQLNQVEARFEEERQRGQREFDAYKNKVAAKEDHLRAEFKSRVKAMQRELDEAKDSFRKRVEQWDACAAELANKADKSDKAALAKMKKAHEKELAALREAHSQEVDERQAAVDALAGELEDVKRTAAEAATQAQARITTLQKEARQREQDLLREKDSVVQGVRSEVESTESTLLSRISYLSASLEAEQKATQTAVAALEERSREIDDLRKTHASELEEARQTAERAGLRANQLAEDLETASRSLERAHGATAIAEDRLRELEASVEQEKQSRRRVESTAEDASEQVLSLERKLKEQARLGTQHVRELQDKLAQREGEIKKLHKIVQDAEGKASSLSALLADERERVTSLKTELATIASGKSEQELETEEQRAQVRALQSKLADAGVEADALREALEAAKLRHDRAEKSHIAERNALQEAHAVASSQAAREARAAQNAHKEALDALRKSLMKESVEREAQARSDHQALVAGLEAAKASALKALETDFVEKLRQQAASRDRAETEAASLRAELGVAQEQVAQLEEAKLASATSLDDAARKSEELRIALRGAEAKVAEIEAAMARMSKEHADALEAREKDASARIRVAVAEQKRADDEVLALARAELQARAATQVAALRSELGQVKDEAASSGTEAAKLRKDLETLREHHEAQLEAFAKKQQRVAQDLRREAAEKAVAEEASWRAKLEQAETRLLADRETAVRKLEARLVEKERALRKEAEQTKQAALDGLRAALQRDAATARAHLETAHSAAVDALHQTLGQERAAAERKIRDAHALVESELRKQLSTTESARNSFEAQLKDLEKELEQTKVQFDDKVTALEQDRSREQKRHEIHLETLRRAHDDQVRSLNASHANDVRALEGERESVRQRLEGEVSQLQKTISYWEHRYEHREPRAEDVKHIAKLNKKLEHAETKVRHAVEEMQFYKLELRNREESYNKVFNRNVNVGVMQVLKPSAQPPAQTAAYEDDIGSARSKRRSKKKRDKEKEKEKEKDRSSRKHKHKSSSSSSHQHASDGIEFPPLDNHSVSTESNQRPMSNQGAARYSSRNHSSKMDQRPEYGLDIGPEEGHGPDADVFDEDDRARGERDASQLVHGKRRPPAHAQSHRRIVNM